ncbi:MAG: hypothetical protein NXY57DRAFT_1000000 [Lentinula lateritia]|uniref:CID domain-containing protein n=1 Tax=Lentinula lateritia TaxID=40482 RepID=A0ABQ8VD78_9AGAR|nr:MAG: hypothetical protein NXY57DRAFT_1000000 [Lentinula lateritia]KAJ4481848.1 hypothetical protein C8R41DRAFT_841578 [Lentinula lateritia]
MSPIEEFESTLKEVVQAKRLSASKMTKLTELAMKLMKDDTRLVSILYRTHKSLSATAKVSSLYIFDALARAAKHQVNKQNLSGDINAPEGNCATFLLKLQGILDGLFKDMVLSGTFEAKEKTKKVLDIWVKGNTFPSTMLSQLADVLKDTVKESTAKAVVSSDPRIAAAQSSASANTPTPPPTSTTPPFPPTSLSSTHIPALSTPLDPQSKILALLTQAINVGAASTSNQASSAGPAPIPSAGPQLDVAHAQLALLQQLTQTAQLGSNMSYSNTGPISVTTDVNANRPYGDDTSGYSSLPGGSPRNRYGSPDDDFRHDGRGGSKVYRGGRERWNEGRGKRDGRDHFRDRDRGAKRSRSRSPPSRYGARREIKPYSPPRRPLPAVRESFDTGDSQPSAGNSEKDEFGRDARSQAPESLKDAAERQIDIHDVAQTTPSAPSPMQPPVTVARITPPSYISTPSAPKTVTHNPSLEQFNVATFDFTNPESWEALGKMWLVSYGTMPTTEQLMQFVMFAGASADPSQMISPDSWDQSGWDGTGNPYMDTQNVSMGGMNGGMAYGGNHLQGQSTANGNWKAGDPRVVHQSKSYAGESSTEKRGGGMRKVGDKWIFVREADSPAL